MKKLLIPATVCVMVSVWLASNCFAFSIHFTQPVESITLLCKVDWQSPDSDVSTFYEINYALSFSDETGNVIDAMDGARGFGTLNGLGDSREHELNFSAEGFAYISDIDVTLRDIHWENHGLLDISLIRMVDDNNIPTPEPTTLLLLGTGIGGLALRRVRSHKKIKR